MSRSYSADELTFDLGYPSGPFGLQVGQPVIAVHIHVTPLLRRRIPHVIRANRELGREKIAIDPDHGIDTRMLTPEELELRSFQLVIWNDGRIGARAVDANWRVLRCRSWQRLMTKEETSKEETPALTR